MDTSDNSLHNSKFSLDIFREELLKLYEEREKDSPKLVAFVCEDGNWIPMEQSRMFNEAMKRAAENYLKDNKEEDGQIQ